MTEITYFVHGTTTDNEQGLSSGWHDADLSQKGTQQSVTLQNLLSNVPFDVVFCSDLIRAVHSAKLNFSGRNIPIICDSRLRECNYGKFNGKDEKLVNYSSHITLPFEDGESLKEVEARIRKFLDYLKSNFSNQKIAIVGHRAPQLALEVILKNKTWEDAIATDWRNTHAWQPGWTYTIN